MLKLPFMTVQGSRYLGMKRYANFYIENYKTLSREIKEDLIKWRDVWSVWTGKFNIVKLSVSPFLSTEVMQWRS